jgi:hypothetical protein
MEPQESRSLAQEAEGVIRRLRGVQAAKVELADSGKIAQVHVLSTADRTAQVVVRDVLAALGAELGVTLEPRQVRVALTREGRKTAGPAPGRPRLKFVGLSLSTVRNTTEVKVQLEHEGLIHEGGASGPNFASHRLELIGMATLRAVETCLHGGELFHLEGALIVPVANRQAALVVVSWLGPDPEEQVFSGSSVVTDDPREAVVRAVLDAVNRLVGALAGP